MKRHFLRFSYVLFLFSVVLLTGNFSGAVVPWYFMIPNESSKPIDVTVEKIVTERDSYNGKEVAVKGTVSNIKFRTSAGGNPYSTFKLIGESGGRINVFIRGRLKFQPGVKVQVKGLYRKIMRVDQRIFYDQIDASEVK
jgi:hypothetical protein